MKRILSILILSLIFICNLYPQSYKFAVFNNLKIDSDSSANKLLEKVKLLNNDFEIKFLIIMGDLTSSGFADELEIAKSTLSNLKIPYYLLPGINDIELSQSMGADYKLTFGKKGFAFEKGDIFHIGLRGVKYELGNSFHFTPGEINRLKNFVNNIRTDNHIILYLNNSLENYDNGQQLQNILADKDIFIIKPFNETKYNILEIQNDSVNIVPNYFDSLSAKIDIDKNYFISKDSAQFIDYSHLSGRKFPNLKANIIWKQDLAIEMPNKVLISDDNIISISKQGVIYSLDYNGKIKWTHKLNEITFSTPAIINNILIIATTEGDLLTINVSTGEIIQSIGIEDVFVTSVLKTKLNYYGEELDAVIVGGISGTFYCYTLKKLELVWSNVFSESNIVTKPLSVNHRIIFGCSDGFLYSIDDRTGVLYWKWKPKRTRKEIVNFSNPISDGKNIFVSTSNGIIYKIDLLLGTTLWKKSNQKAGLSLGLSSTGRTVISRDTRGKVNLLYSKTGGKYGKIKQNFGKEKIKHTPIEWKRNFIISSDKGTVYLIDKKYKHKPLFFMGNAALHSVQKVDQNKFIASNSDGKIVLFTLQ